MEKKFTDILENNTEINEKLDIAEFIDNIKKYGSLDDYLVNDEKAIDFYIDNQKKLDYLIKKHKLHESNDYFDISVIYEDEVKTNSPQFSPGNKKYSKIIKYNGELFELVYNPDYNSWAAIPRFRSITNALKYGRFLIDNMDI